MGPGVFGAGVTQLNLLISTALASLLPGGSVSYLYYADRLNQLPLGVVGIAVGTAILPPLSRQVRTGDARRRGGDAKPRGRAGAAVDPCRRRRRLSCWRSRSCRSCSSAAPSARPRPRRLRRRSPLTRPGCRPLCWSRCWRPAFSRTTTPRRRSRSRSRRWRRISCLTLGLMQVLGACRGRARVVGLAGWMQALTLLVLLDRRGHFRLDRRVARNLPRIAAAALGMGARCWGRCAMLLGAGAGRAARCCGSARWPG